MVTVEKLVELGFHTYENTPPLYQKIIDNLSKKMTHSDIVLVHGCRYNDFSKSELGFIIVIVRLEDVYYVKILTEKTYYKYEMFTALEEFGFDLGKDIYNFIKQGDNFHILYNIKNDLEEIKRRTPEIISLFAPSQKSARK